MYILLYEYFFNNNIASFELNNDENDICFICWINTNENNKLIQLEQICNINKKCKCNPKIHSLCLNDWIKCTLTCPICRQRLTVDEPKTKSIIIFNKLCIEYTLCFLKCMSYSLLIVILCLLSNIWVL